MRNALDKIKHQARLQFHGRKKLAHLVPVIVVLGYLLLPLFDPAALEQSGSTAAFYTGYAIIYLFFWLGLSYTCLLVLLPLLYPRRAKIWFWLAFAANLVFWLLARIILHNVWQQFYTHSTGIPVKMNTSLGHGHYDIIFFLLFIFLYYFIDIYDHQQEIRKLEGLKTEKLMLETSLLQSQINPHFLFNTLNNIYSLSLARSPETRNIIARLREQLHYMLYDCRAERVPLAQELEFMQRYISLEKIRHPEEQCKVSVSVTGNPGNEQIVPLLLINFLENAFKHGVKAATEGAWIRMDVVIQPGSLVFDLRNSKPAPVSSALAISEQSGGIGIQNVKRRLELLYPGRHQLQITETAQEFDVLLQLQLKK